MIENIRSGKKRSNGMRIRLDNRFEGTVTSAYSVRGAVRGNGFIHMVIHCITMAGDASVWVSKA